MQVDDKLIDRLAMLSRLNFEEAEKQSIRDDMQKIIGFVEKLNELDTTGITPLRHMSTVVNVTRPDVLKGSVSREDALANAAHHSEEFFKVPKVISK